MPDFSKAIARLLKSGDSNLRTRDDSLVSDGSFDPKFSFIAGRAKLSDVTSENALDALYDKVWDIPPEEFWASDGRILKGVIIGTTVIVGAAREDVEPEVQESYSSRDEAPKVSYSHDEMLRKAQAQVERNLREGESRQLGD